MQRYCTELTERLLKSLDKEYNVVNMGAVVDVITALEKTTITKEVLEITRLGKYINELRRKTSNDALAKRAKDLVRRWRDMVLPSTAHAIPQATPADTAPYALNGTNNKPQSPSLRGLKPQSPAIRGLMPQSPALKNFKPNSPLMRDTTPLRQVLSPALSLHSDQSRSPNPTPTKPQHPQQQQQSQQQQYYQPSLPQPAPTTRSSSSLHTNPRISSSQSPKLLSTSNNSQLEAVPRTHSSNKRLRKDENSPSLSPHLNSSSKSVVDSSRLEPSAKRPRLNGENLSTKLSESYASNNNLVVTRGSLNNASSRSSLPPQVPSPRKTDDKTANERLTDVSTPVDKSRESGDLLAAPGPKKRGRKKGSKSVKNQNLPEDRVKEKLASISRNPKLKTTQELLADLRARGSSIAGAPPRVSEPPSNEEVLRNTDERSLASRFLRSTRDNKSSKAFSDSSKVSGNSPKSKRKSSNTGKLWEDDESNGDENDASSRSKELTVEEILAKLPPLDLDSINWSDECADDDEDDDIDDEDRDKNNEKIKDICETDVQRLHGECIEGLNGNFQVKLRVTGEDHENIQNREKETCNRNTADEWSADESKIKSAMRRFNGDEDQREFREWHEMLDRPSFDGQTLHILPYVIID